MNSMYRIKVRKFGYDWAVVCNQHDRTIWCLSHADAISVADAHWITWHEFKFRPGVA